MTKGWPEIQIEDSYVDSDPKWPEIEGETIRTFSSASAGEDDDLRAIKTFRRDGLKLLLVNEWVSEKEQEDRRKREESEKRWQAWAADFKANDPLYLTYKARETGDPWLKPSGYESHGTTHDRWCHDFKERETRWCKRIHDGRRKGYTIDLEWAVRTGPVKLVIFKNGKSGPVLFFPHSVARMNAAFDHAKGLLVE
jgi:hypothetical protein